MFMHRDENRIQSYTDLHADDSNKVIYSSFTIMLYNLTSGCQKQFKNTLYAYLEPSDSAVKTILAIQIRWSGDMKASGFVMPSSALTENWISSPVHFKHLPHYLTFQLGCSRNISHLLWPINQCELTLNGFGCYNMALRGRTRKFSAYKANVRESKGCIY